MNIFNLNEISALATLPSDADMFNKWMLQEDVLDFLLKDAQDEYVILYTAIPFVYIYAILAPNLDPSDYGNEGHREWGCDPYSSWSEVSNGQKLWLEGPLESNQNDLIRGSEQLVFGRHTQIDTESSVVYELNQKITHLLGINYVPHRKAWCRLDDNGDIEEVAKIVPLTGLNRPGNYEIVCIKKASLARYAVLTNQCLFRMFDFTRFDYSSFNGWPDNLSNTDLSDGETVFGSITASPGNGSYSRGVQFVTLFDDALIQEQLSDQMYCEFVVQDWKNAVISSVSCSKESTSNYHQQSDLPFDLSPAFFRPEVLVKYKSDTEKYSLRGSDINCRDTWHLQSYDVNPAGQISAYLKDLRLLPYSEQQHWQQYNEPPKVDIQNLKNPGANISEGAFISHFLGKFSDIVDPLSDLKYFLTQLHSSKCEWWDMVSDSEVNKTHYPFTDSKDEWANELMNLDKLLVEGLKGKFIKQNVAQLLGTKPDPNFRSLKLLELWLTYKGFDDDTAKGVLNPLRELHNLRSKVKGHNTGSEAIAIAREVLKNHGSFKKHFRDLVEQCHESFVLINEAIEVV
jgi:hypothetical protein